MKDSIFSFASSNSRRKTELWHEEINNRSNISNPENFLCNLIEQEDDKVSKNERPLKFRSNKLSNNQDEYPSIHSKLKIISSPNDHQEIHSFAQDQFPKQRINTAQLFSSENQSTRENKSIHYQAYSERKKADDRSFNQKATYTPEVMQLLQNCKASIVTLQNEVEQKCQTILKLQKQKLALDSRLIQAERQVQRTHQILNIYIKQAKNHPNAENQSSISVKKFEAKDKKPFEIQNEQSQSSNQQEIYQLNRQIQFLKTTNFNLSQENFHLKRQISLLQNEVCNLDGQNRSLNHKILKMGKGVGKALSTIKKNNSNSKNFSQLMAYSRSQTKYKTNGSKRQHGKILLIKKSPMKQSEIWIEYLTPSKIASSLSTANKSLQLQKSDYQQFSPQKCERKLTDISTKAKRLDQIEKLQNLLSKMQQLTEPDQESSHDTSH